MLNTLSISALVRPDMSKLGVTYAITLAEQLCVLGFPALTGLAVDGLLAQSFSGLIALVAVWFLQLTLSFVRQRYDTRVFTRIYARVAKEVVLRQREAGENVSEISARAELSREFVEFFEVELPSIAHNLTAVVGGLAFLFAYDVHAGFIAASVLLPLALANARFLRQSTRLNRGLNDQIEREVRTLASGSAFAVGRHFQLLSRWKIALSDAKSLAWVLTEATTVIALTCILLDFTIGGQETVSAGAVYAIIAYTFNYLGGLNDVPNVVNAFTRLRDIKSRLS